MAHPILVTGAAGRVGAVGRTVTELLLKHGKAVRAMVRTEDDRAQALRNMGAEVVVGDRELPIHKRLVKSGTGCRTDFRRQSARGSPQTGATDFHRYC